MGLRTDGLKFVVLVLTLAVRITIEEMYFEAGDKVDIPFADRTSHCRAVSGLSKSQVELCKQQPDISMAALKGLNNAVIECQNQFKNNRWNCSSLKTKGKNPYISAILQRGFKETAFSYAIASAGVVIEVARACSSSKLHSCGCDEKNYKQKKSIKNKEYHSRSSSRLKVQSTFNDISIPKEGNRKVISSIYTNKEGYSDKSVSISDGKQDWKWSGCSDNLKVGLRFSKTFLDSRERGDDIRSRTNLQNNQVGRLIVKHNMSLKCKCHGMSGSCLMKTCWRSTPELKIVGRLLKEKYSSAVFVDSNLVDTNLIRKGAKKPKMVKTIFPKSMNKRPRQEKFKKNRGVSSDLLYYEKSPNFCDSIPSLDLSGTTGRFCNSTIKVGPNSCSSLCCGRGYNSIKQTKQELCKCQFIWCCEVQCERCNNTSWVSVCK